MKRKEILMITLFSLSALLFIVGSFAAIKIFIAKYPIYFSWDENSYINFFNWFDFSLKFYAASIALLTLAITTMRAFQFDKNLELLVDNNTFNNFYKHREEFILFMNKTSFFTITNRSPDQDNRLEIIPFYDEYFYRNHKNFTPSLNQRAEDEINNFFNELHFIDIKNKPFIDLDLENLKSIDDIIHPYVGFQMGNLINSKKKQIEEYFFKTNGKIATEEKTKIKLREQILLKIYAAMKLYNALLAFDGIELPSDYNYPARFEEYSVKSELYKK